ncbi:hypothetical protein MMC14_007312 [Varicellaria rhodocarpa]|nr:hypothetical protein [Varicellaria rhodocarpa]
MAGIPVQRPALKNNLLTPVEVAIQGFNHLFSWGSTSLQSWSSPQVEVVIGEGSGQYVSPFSISALDFAEKCLNFDFSPKLLKRLQDHGSLFEHVFRFAQESGTSQPSSFVDAPTHLEILMTNYENDAFFCLFRYSIKTKKAKCLLFIKSGDYSERPLIRMSDVREWLEAYRQTLDQNPLMVLNAILGLVQSRAHEFVEWRIQLNNMESRLGVTEYAEALREGRYEAISHDFELLNADVARLSKRVADNALSAATILEHAKALQRLVAICDEFELSAGETRDHRGSRTLLEQREETQSTIARAELYLQFTKMIQVVLQSQTAILYNRVNKQDSQSMKTIAVVTLLFLPATFVSAVCASGVFNFQASEPADQLRVISKYGWVYLLVCLLVTAGTLVLWLAWYVWGRKMLETSRLSRLGQRDKLA